MLPDHMTVRVRVGLAIREGISVLLVWERNPLFLPLFQGKMLSERIQHKSMAHRLLYDSILQWQLGRVNVSIGWILVKWDTSATFSIKAGICLCVAGSFLEPGTVWRWKPAGILLRKVSHLPITKYQTLSVLIFQPVASLKAERCLSNCWFTGDGCPFLHTYTVFTRQHSVSS